MRCSRFVVLPVLLLAANCTAAPNPAADEAAIRTVDSQMVAALNARNLDGWLGHLADDAQMLPPGAPAVAGKPAIRQLLSGLLGLPNFAVTHHPATVTMGRGGDLAYVQYAYELAVPDTAGGSVTEKGKDISVFRKRPDGTWVLVVDMWSPDQ